VAENFKKWKISLPGILKGRKSQKKNKKKLTAISPLKNFLKSVIKKNQNKR